MSDQNTSDQKQFEEFLAFQQGVIDEFRANDGKVGGMFEGSTLCLITTTGARTGRPRTQPLGLMQVDGQDLVVASAGGAPTHPAWYHNIRKNPIVTVEKGSRTFRAIASIPPGEERDGLFAQIVAQEPGYGEYQKNTDRVIPVVVLHPVDLAPDRVKHLGDELVEVHDWLRGELKDLRRRIDDVVEGRAGDVAAAADTGDGGVLARLRSHCLDFCHALHIHHAGEDIGAFPVLRDRFPALAPVLDRFAEEHKTVVELQNRIKALVEEFAPDRDDPVRLRAEVEDLASRLEAHFDEEERQLVTALNAMGPAPERG
ncbi:nitroreductase family deazaflavin-dependent oxidoreductase [Streptomyces solincola]|uniref:Nitroreductase family deazaflavin-dependent oxidoreductase n=1 Tax=Streptomyces solincola TaxID=2100817 RepID=A0A2S9Q1D9_9ACTN|nr:nitroreductase/quinone reductase family protein [Streptomyces solincola]PRH80500.1 nitroreductase family deazaflavin-dependent oxidoreductase [Streptomyces solincola]